MMGSGFYILLSFCVSLCVREFHNSSRFNYIAFSDQETHFELFNCAGNLFKIQRNITMEVVCGCSVFRLVWEDMYITSAQDFPS